MTPAAQSAEVAFQRAVAAKAPFYALLDAARESRGPYEAQQANLECQSLLAGELGDLLADVAPYLIEFRQRSSFKTWWFDQWGNSIGLLVEAAVSLADLRRHFRTVLLVHDDQCKHYHFRFYDPRVLRVFLPACTPEELKQFFGPIVHFYCESAGGKELLVFSSGTNGLSVKAHPMNPPPARTASSLRDGGVSARKPA